jgi:hypothetical protein
VAKHTAVDEQSDNAAVMDRMADILEQLQKNAPPNEPGFGHPDYQARLREEGFFADFAKPVYQNGKEAQARGLKPETIDRAPKLRPGKYLGGVVEVAKDHRDRIHLMYASVRERDRLNFAQKVRNFDDLIDQIWTEMHAA